MILPELARRRMAWAQLTEKLGRSGVAAQLGVVRLDHYAPNRHDTGSTRARSVDEVALIWDTISHYAPVLIAQNSSQRPWRARIFFLRRHQPRS
jgi:hypothetical protein